MPEKNRSIYIEHIFTFAQLVIIAGLLGSALSTFGLFACIGVMSGFAVSWFYPAATDNAAFKTAGKVIALLTVIWTFYAVFNSTFGYQEVALIYIKAALILEVILSFNVNSPVNLNYMQALSVPVFMTFPIFTSTISAGHMALLATYLAAWVVLLRVKFCLSYSPAEELNLLERQHLLPFIFFIVAVALAWALYYYILLPVNKEGGLLRQKGISQTMPELEKQYYGMRDKLQEDATKITYKLPGKDQRHKSLSDLESLIGENTLTIVVNDAEEGLVSLMKTPGPGLEKGETMDLTVLIQKFVDKKIEFNLKKANSRMMEILRENPLNLGVRIWAVAETAKLQRADTLDKLREYKKDIQNTLMSTDLGARAKDEEKELTRKVQDWKIFQMYRGKMQELKEQIVSAGSPEKLKDAYNKLKDAQTQQALDEAEAEAAKIASGNGTEEKKIGNKLKETIDLKRNMLINKERSKIESAVQEAYLPEQSAKQVNNDLNDLQYSEEAQETINAHNSLANTFDQESVNAGSELNAASNMKSSSMINSLQNDLEQALQAAPQGLSNQIKKDLSFALRANNSNARQGAFSKVSDQVNQLRQDGFVSGQKEEQMQKTVDDIKQLAEFKAQLKSGVTKTLPKKTQANQTVNRTVNLIKIRVTPASVTVPSGRDALIHAIGYYDDNTQKEITGQVEWQISDSQTGRFLGGKVIGLKPGKALFSARRSNIVSQQVPLIVTDPVLTAIVAKPSRVFLSPDDELVVTAEGYYSDNSHSDITSLVSWQMQSENIFRRERNVFHPLRFGKESIWAEYKSIKSQPIEIKVGVTLAWLLKVIGIFLLGLLFLLLIVLLVLHSLSRMRAAGIAALNPADKRAFIIALYNNHFRVFALFGLGNKGNLPPLGYAAYTALLLGAEKACFERFAAGFEKAQYSLHDISDEDAKNAYSDYRQMAAVLLKERRGSYLFMHLARLLKRLPVNI